MPLQEVAWVALLEDLLLEEEVVAEEAEESHPTLEPDPILHLLVPAIPLESEALSLSTDDPTSTTRHASRHNRPTIKTLVTVVASPLPMLSLSEALWVS